MTRLTLQITKYIIIRLKGYIVLHMIMIHCYLLKRPDLLRFRCYSDNHLYLHKTGRLQCFINWNDSLFFTETTRLTLTSLLCILIRLKGYNVLLIEMIHCYLLKRPNLLWLRCCSGTGCRPRPGGGTPRNSWARPVGGFRSKTSSRRESRFRKSEKQIKVNL